MYNAINDHSRFLAAPLLRPPTGKEIDLLLKAIRPFSEEASQQRHRLWPEPGVGARWLDGDLPSPEQLVAFLRKLGETDIIKNEFGPEIERTAWRLESGKHSWYAYSHMIVYSGALAQQPAMKDLAFAKCHPLLWPIEPDDDSLFNGSQILPTRPKTNPHGLPLSKTLGVNPSWRNQVWVMPFMINTSHYACMVIHGPAKCVYVYDSMSNSKPSRSSTVRSRS